MIEVFIAFSKESNIEELERTLEAWDSPGLEPIAIQVKQSEKFELHRRVAAENVSRGTYILSNLGYGPLEEEFGALAQQAIDNSPEAGLIVPGGVATAIICRRGIITHWPVPRTPTYYQEHVQAYELAGYKTISCPTIHSFQLVESLPS